MTDPALTPALNAESAKARAGRGADARRRRERELKPIKVNLVAGFLGSGKTTLLRHYLKNSGGERAAVLVNEVGDAAIEPRFARQRKAEVLEFAQGCLCCQNPSELVLALRSLARRRPDRILIESTGIAEPARIVKTLLEAPSLRGLISIEPTVVVVDAAGFFSLFQTLAYYYITQLRAADVVILNKADVATRAQLAGAEREVRKTQPRALVVRARHGRVDLRGILEGAPAKAASGFQAHRLRLDGVLDPAGLRSFLERLPGGIYRAKGRVRFPGGSHRVDYLTGSYAQEPIEAPAGPPNELVFIGSKVDAPALSARLKRCLLAAATLCLLGGPARAEEPELAPSVEMQRELESAESANLENSAARSAADSGRTLRFIRALMAASQTDAEAASRRLAADAPQDAREEIELAVQILSAKAREFAVAASSVPLTLPDEEPARLLQLRSAYPAKNRAGDLRRARLDASTAERRLGVREPAPAAARALEALAGFVTELRAIAGRLPAGRAQALDADARDLEQEAGILRTGPFAAEGGPPNHRLRTLNLGETMPTLTKTKTKAPVAPRLKQYIGGRWVEGGGDREIASVNPADIRETVAVFRNASPADAVRAIDAAQAAAPGWKATPAPQRGRILAKAVEIARRRIPELARLMTREQGKIVAEAAGEMEKGINLLEWFSGEGYRFMGETAPSDLPRNLLYTLRQPLGVVSVITPWNFPWAIPCWKMAPALVAGNTVVFKPASLIPAFSVEIVRIFEEAGLPPGVLNLVLGSGSSVGNLLVEDPRIKAVSFTGSNSIGKGVHTIAGRRGIRATCEMGGKNPCVVWEDADLDLALGGVLRGAFGSTGQRCTATSRLLLHEKIADRFLESLVAETRKIRLGDGLDPKTTMGPAVDQGQLDTDLEYIEIAKKEGARLLTGGRRADAGELKHGFFVEPTIFDGVKPSMRLWQEEVFGPVLAVNRFKTFEDALRLANDCPFGLTSAVYTQDLSVAMRFVDEMEAGMVHVNSPTIGGEPTVPFGGVKGSGVGEREMAKEGVRFFSEPKTVFLDYTGERRASNIY